MPVPTQLSDLSATAASNSPAGGESVGTLMNDYIQAIQSIIARIAAGTDALTAPSLGAPTAAGRISANLGLTVAGGTFISRGITDNATATALTLSGSGANSITIANSATNPTISTTGGATVPLAFNTTGGAYHSFSTNGFEQVRVAHTASADRYITLTGSNGGTPTIGTSAGSLAITSALSCTSTIAAAGTYIQAANATATPAGGAVSTGLFMGSASIGIYFGSGAPTVSAAQGSLYIRTDGGASTRLYSNNNGSTGWSSITSA